MAKGDLGEYYSILGTAQQASFNAQRKALEDERKKARRDRYLSYLVEPVIGAVGKEIVSLVKTPFEEKYKDFANSAVAIQERVKTKTVNSLNDEFKNQEKSRAMYSGGADAWYKDSSIKEATQNFLRANPEDGEAKLKTGIYNSVLDEDAKIIETFKKNEDEKRRKLLIDFEASGTLEESLKNKRTSTITGRFIDVFQGDSTEKQDARALEEFRKSLYYTNREALLAFDLDIEEGKPIVAAVTEAQATALAEAHKNYTTPFTTTTIATVIDKDGNRRVVTTLSTYNRGSKEWENGKQPVTTSSTEAVVMTPKMEAEIEAGLVRDANAQFNYRTRAATDFTLEAYLAYKDEVEKAGVNINDIKTIKERQIAADIYNTYDKLENYKAEASTKLAQKNRDEALLADIMATDMPFQEALDKYRNRDVLKDGEPINKLIIDNYYFQLETMTKLLADMKLALDPKVVMPKQVIPGTPSVTRSPIQGAPNTSGQAPIMPPAAEEEEEEEAPVTTTATKLPIGHTKENADGTVIELVEYDKDGNPIWETI
jgi:hypothetical protein